MKERTTLIANNSSILDKTTKGKEYVVASITELPAIGNRTFTIINDEGNESLPIDTSFMKKEAGE